VYVVGLVTLQHWTLIQKAIPIYHIVVVYRKPTFKTNLLGITSSSNTDVTRRRHLKSTCSPTLEQILVIDGDWHQSRVMAGLQWLLSEIATRIDTTSHQSSTERYCTDVRLCGNRSTIGSLITRNARWSIAHKQLYYRPNQTNAKK